MKRWLGIPLLLLVLVGWALKVKAQQSIKGTLIDAETEEPIGYATIGVKGKSIGIVTNQNGDFQIPLSYQGLGDTMMVSCIGYELTQVPLMDLRIDQMNRVAIRKADYALPEATVSAKKRRKVSATAIVRRALRNIPQNYPQKPFSYKAYYRDYQKDSAQYINLNEAIVEVFDGGFQTDDRFDTQILLYDYQKNTDFPIDQATAINYDNSTKKFVANAALSPFGGNKLSILMIHDAIRNHRVHSYSFVDTLAIDFIHQHKFEFAKPVAIGEQILHCIEFEGRATITGPNLQARGKIYIENENYAIHKLIYTMHEKRDKEGIDRLLYDLQLEYVRNEQFMFLNYISFYNLFLLAEPPLFTVANLELNFNQKKENATLSDQFDGRRAISNPRIEISFNQPPNFSTALNKKNYSITHEHQKMNITNIRKTGAKSINIFLAHDDFLEIIYNPEVAPHIKYGDIFDLNGHKLNEPNYVEVSQYRELFRQEINPNYQLPEDPTFIDRDTTLQANFIQLEQVQDLKSFWINTPLKN